MKETEGKPRSLKVTIKLKRDANISNHSSTADKPKNVVGELNAPKSSNLSGSLVTDPQDQVQNVAGEPNALNSSNLSGSLVNNPQDQVQNVAGEPNAVNSSNLSGSLVTDPQDQVQNVAGEPNAVNSSNLSGSPVTDPQDQVQNVPGEPNAVNSSNLSGSLMTDPQDQVQNVAGEPNALNSSNPSGSPVTDPQDQVENVGPQVEENPSPENSQYQIVVYDPSVNGNAEVETGHAPKPAVHRPRRPHPFSDQTPRVLPAVGVFTAQCATCFKWRLIPAKEKYDEIRAHIAEQPFSCETAREWRPNISCDDPPDMTQDGSRIWAIDKPSIPLPPPGWQRLLRIRGEGSTKFADVYYVAPTGKRLRSMVEIQRFLNDHPKYIEEGITMSQFSFQTPRPLREDYVRKRRAGPGPSDNLHDSAMPVPLDLAEVKPIAWASPDVATDLPVSSAGISSNRFAASEIQPSKKKKKSAKKGCSDEVVCNHNKVKVEDSPHL